MDRTGRTGATQLSVVTSRDTALLCSLLGSYNSTQAGATRDHEDPLDIGHLREDVLVALLLAPHRQVGILRHRRVHHRHEHHHHHVPDR